MHISVAISKCCKITYELLGHWCVMGLKIDDRASGMPVFVVVVFSRPRKKSPEITSQSVYSGHSSSVIYSLVRLDTHAGDN